MNDGVKPSGMIFRVPISVGYGRLVSIEGLESRLVIGQGGRRRRLRAVARHVFPPWRHESSVPGPVVDARTDASCDLIGERDGVMRCLNRSSPRAFMNVNC